MPDLKKYMTEGLIQVAILLSLAGMRVDVDPYLPHLNEIILGPSSALTQTQFHNLRNILDGHNLHPKSVDLDGFFTARRLLTWVRSLDRLHVPAAELEAWLVHRESDNVVSIPSQAGLLEDGGGIEDEESSELSLRLGSGGEVGFNVVENQTLGALGHMSRSLNHLDDDDELIKEDEDSTSFFWDQDAQSNIQQEQLDNRATQPASWFNEEDTFMEDSWRNTNPFHNQMFGEDLQLSSVRDDEPLSLEECLNLIDTSFPSEEDQELTGPDVQNTLEFQRPLFSPLIPEEESTFSLEQQWQDVLAIVQSQGTNTTETTDDSPHNISGNIGSMENFIHQNVSLHHQVSQPRFTEEQNSISMEETCPMNNNNNLTSNVVASFEDSDIIDLLLSTGSDLSNPLDPILEEAMLEEMDMMDLDLEELNQTQLEDQNRADSDSGLSLNCSQSPASPSGSESSSSSSSSSCSSPSSPTPSLEGAVGYDHIKEEEEDFGYAHIREEEDAFGYAHISDEEDTFGSAHLREQEDSFGYAHIKEEEEDGAVGGFMPGQSKMCQSSVLEARHFHHLPWLEHIGHDHTYNQPQIIQKRPPKDESEEEEKTLEHLSGRDEKRARLMNIPFSNEHIVNLAVDEFNRLLSKYHLSEAQLTLIRDIRRRGKNKMAAQNCRRRKLDVLLGLQCNVDGLRRRRTKLLKEKTEIMCSIREMKRRLNSLYQEVYERLREEQGLLYSDIDFTLQRDTSVNVASHKRSDSNSKRKISRRQKHKK